MRRLITAATAAVLTTSLLAPPAHAADVVIVSRTGVEAGTPALHITSAFCGDPGQPTTQGFTFSRVTGPAPAPLGDGSLRIVRQQVDLISGVAFLAGRHLTDLEATLQGEFRAGFTGEVQAVVGYFGSTVWLGVATVPLAANTWTPVDFTEKQFRWFDGIATTETKTLADFRSSHGDQNVAGLVGVSACAGSTTGTVFLDDLRIGSGTDTQIFDFEPLLPTAVTATASKSTITNGGGVLLSTKLTSDGTPLAGRPVELLHKPFGQSSYTSLGTVDTNASGIASLTQFPKKNTSYQWRYGGDTQEYAASHSPTVSVGVRARVTHAPSHRPHRSRPGRVVPAGLASDRQ